MSHTKLRGVGVSPGIAIGEPVVHETRTISTLRIPILPEGIEAEIHRFRSAIESTVEAIRGNKRRAQEEMGEEYAAIFEAHQLIASDPSLTEPIEEIIRTEGVNAEWALDQVAAKFVAQFEALGDAYLSERKLDVLDVATQIMDSLQGLDLSQLSELDRPVILVADDLPPSRTVQLPMDKVLGFALETGGPTSHTTIIARSLGVPVIVGAHGLCQAALNSRIIALDAFEGKIVFDPDPAELREFESRQTEYREQQHQLIHVQALPTVTRDGRPIELLANIDLPSEVEKARQWNVDGIGLYRSEFLYMKASPGLPSEKDHVEFYQELVEGIAPHPVTIRTFDLGGKKLAREVIGSPEANPVLGLRGIRLCLMKKDFFRTQLRGLLRVAGQYESGRVRILVPLITGIEEMRVVRLLVSQITEELRDDGYEVHDAVPLGAMVEVPSAAVMARELSKEVNFVSIGTNDLIQYSLAVDRSNELVAGLYQPNNPAVLRLIAQVIEAGDGEGIDVTMCGEAAADPLMVPVLIGLGLRRMSMNPQAVSVVRSLIRQLSYRETVHLARKALRMATARDVEELLLERLAISFAKTRIPI